MKFMLTIPVLAVSLFSGAALAGERGTAVTGALIGGAAGAALGHHMSGRDGAIVGGALGAAVGTSIATDRQRAREAQRDSDYDRDAYLYNDDDDDDDDYRYRERVVYAAPVVHERVVYVQPRPVLVYQPVRRVVRYEYAGRHDQGWHRGHHNDRAKFHRERAKFYKERYKEQRKHHREWQEN